MRGRGKTELVAPLIIVLLIVSRSATADDDNQQSNKALRGESEHVTEQETSFSSESVIQGVPNPISEESSDN